MKKGRAAVRALKRQAWNLLGAVGLITMVVLIAQAIGNR
jgi:hypothetical protein